MEDFNRASEKDVNLNNGRERDMGGWRRAASIGGAGVALGALCTLGVSQETSYETTLGPHRAELSLTFDGYSSVDLGPLGGLRMPMNTPLGVGVTYKVAEVIAPKEVVGASYAATIQNPEGIIEQAQSDVLQHVGRSALVGFPIGALMLSGTLFGAKRLQNRFPALGKKGIAVGAGLTSATLVGASFAYTDSNTIEAAPWRPAEKIVEQDILKLLPPILHEIEGRGALFEIGTGLAQQFVRDNFIEAAEQYNILRTNLAEEMRYRVAPKKEGEVRVLVVSDRHDNTNMDPLISDVAAVNGVDVLINAGDNVAFSDNQAWERFSNASHVAWTEDIRHRVYVRGNHDPAVGEEGLVDHGFVDLNTYAVTEVAGLRLVGAPDHRYHDFNKPVHTDGNALATISEKLADAACTEKDPVQIVIGHDEGMHRDVLARNCAQLAVSGHTHTLMGPVAHESPLGTKSYAVTNGSTGGAKNVIAIGPLAYPATMLVFRFEPDDSGELRLQGGDSYEFLSNESVSLNSMGSLDDTKTIHDLRTQPSRLPFPVSVRAAERIS